ncbi:MAG: acyl-CoA dehydrogenase family protein [Bdellovibrionota bacterium]
MSGDLTASFVRSMCIGEIEEELLFPYPKLKDTEKEMLKSIFDSIATWLKPKTEDFRKWDQIGDQPPELIEEIKQMGLFGLIIPEEFGGLGLSTMAYSRIIQELSRYDGSIALTVGEHSSIGMRGVLMFGNDEQKKKYLPKLATGELIAAYCLTESGAGSDAASIKTKAHLDGDHWVLNGEKIWITNGGIANFFTVFAATDTPEGKITAFIVTPDMGTISIGPHEDKMGIRANSTTTVNFDNVRVPKANVLGEVGKGFKVAVKILNNGRTGLGGGCVGGMKKCIELATKHAKERKQFGQSISEFGLIKKKIGQMTVDCYASESVVTMVSGLIDQGYEDYAVEAAISKIFASEALWRCSDEALQVAGGNGFMREYPYERMMRDCRINRIFEGANEVLTLFVALTAMKDAVDQLKGLSQAINIGSDSSVFKDPIKGFGVLKEYARMRVATKTKYGRPSFTKAHADIKAVAVLFEDEMQNLVNVVDQLLRKHGKAIIGKQFATSRLANIMIDMFVMACMISRVTQALEEKGPEASSKEIEILQTFAFQAKRRMKDNQKQIDRNMDEEIKSLAVFATEQEHYAWDIL